ncbi:MAG: SDR family NAD(P)-dependent oxidoreductase [Planctomycetaceae bacterium]
MSLPKAFLEGKVAIVTGASSGIGAEVARALAHRGLNVVLAARRKDRLQALALELEVASSVKVLVVPTDVTSSHDLRNLVEQTLTAFGRVDLLINNAGVEAFAPFHSLTDLQINQIIAVNLGSAIKLSQLVIPHMRAQGWGHIVNMASATGLYAPPYSGVYAATKAGLIALTQSLRHEYRRDQIRCSAICPGFTESSEIYTTIRRDAGRATPRILGTTTASKVARETIRAIRKDRPQLIVNRIPLRPFFVLTSAFPALGDYLFRKFGLRYFRKLGRPASVVPDEAQPPRRREAA